MIRINLLEVRPKSTERLDALLSPGGSSTFISRREGLLGVAFLVLTVVILGVLAYRFSADGDDEPETVAAAGEVIALSENVPPEPEPPAPAVTPEPQAEAESAPEPVAPEPAAAEPPAPEQVSPEPAAPARPRPSPSPAPAPQPVASSQGAAGGPGVALTALRVTPLADRVDIFLETAGSPQVRSFNVDNPPRVVFDIPGARLQVADPQRDQAVDSPLVTRLRVAQNTFDPPLVRLVLEVPAFPSTDVSTNSAGLSIRVTPAQ